MSATDELRPWWERLPERLDWELANFADLGLTARLDERYAAPVIITAITLSDGRTVPMQIGFSHEHPILAPRVHVESGLLGPPHESSGLLCLFDAAENQWNPGRSAAELVDGRVRALLEGVLVTGNLDPAAEEQIPSVHYLRYLTNAEKVVFVPDPFWGDPTEGVGSGTIVLQGDGRRRFLRYADGFDLAADLADRVDCEGGVRFGRWVALPGEPTDYLLPEGVLDLARTRCPEVLEPVTFGKVGPMLPSWIAINFLGPGVRAGEKGRRWGFVELTGPDTVPPAALAGWEVQPLTLAERTLRTPELAGLETSKVLLLGAGSLGSKVAVELAKAGCGAIVLVDHDVYEAGNSVRHELAPLHAGEPKAEALARQLELLNPFCKVLHFRFELGQTAPSTEILEQIAGADLVVETTGQRATTRLCERYCRISGTSLLCASLTRGSRGGDMVLLGPDRCFDCFLLAQQEGQIPTPPRGSEEPPVIPVGCGSPAFSGSGFDSSELASAVTRMAIRATGRTRYPALDHDWAILDFLGEPGRRQGVLVADPACGHHP
jgi:molybdopterin/thiamine biosynthesis adenylyltransferase